MKKLGWVAAILWLCGCAEGTNTGNPGLSSPTGAISTVSYALVDEVCSRVAFCFPTADLNTCLSQAPALNGYTSKLGGPADTFSTMMALANAETEQKVVANPAKSETCRKSIRELSCSDSLMLGSYDQGNPAAYSTTNLLFDVSPSCREIYQ